MTISSNRYQSCCIEGTDLEHETDHCIPEDLVQSAIVMASFVYHAAVREEMLPRKPLSIPVEMK